MQNYTIIESFYTMSEIFETPTHTQALCPILTSPADPLIFTPSGCLGDGADSPVRLFAKFKTGQEVAASAKDLSD